jgi:hypothetical protein
MMILAGAKSGSIWVISSTERGEGGRKQSKGRGHTTLLTTLSEYMIIQLQAAG